MSIEPLMDDYCRVDSSAFGPLYARVAPPLLSHLRGMLGDHASAEDVLQQTFMKLHASRASFIPGAAPMPFLYSIAHRTCLDELRRRKRSRVRLDPRGDAPLEVEAAFCGRAVESISTEPYDDHDRARVLAALSALPVSQRTAVELTKLQGMSIAHAAAALGISVGAVKQRVHRAYLALRPVLATSEP